MRLTPTLTAVAALLAAPLLALAQHVGIGTPAPDRPLTIQPPAGSVELLSLKNNTGLTRWHYNLLGGGLNLAESGVADYRLYVQPGGRVGVGTSAPTQALDVNGQLRVRGLSGTEARLPLVQPDGTLSVNPPVFTASSPTPAMLGSVATGQVPTAMALAGTTACVVDSYDNTLKTFDVSNPAAPVLRGTIATGRVPVGIAISGTVAYVVNNSSKTLQTFSIANPAAPVLLGSIGLNSFPTGVAVSGTTAYVIANPTVLLAFSVANPAAPVLLSSFVLTNLAPVALTLSGTTAYVVGYSTSNGIDALTTLNVANPAAPVRLAALTTDDGSSDVVVSGPLAYVVNKRANTLQTINVANPAAPVVLGREGTGQGPASVAVSGTVAVVANQADNTLQVFDVANPALPSRQASLGTSTGPVSVATNGTTAYVIAQYGRQLQAFNVPTPPRLVAVNSDGTLGSAPLLSSRDFIQNQYAVPQAASFYLGGKAAFAGLVGIGTTSPAVPLDVRSTGQLNTVRFIYYAFGTGGPNTGGPFIDSPTNVSIRAAGRVVAAEFNATSDARLKTVLGRSDPAADLALLRQLRITDYQMRDRAQFGAQRFKKVIAQEVEQVFPQAVGRHAGFLPDVYALATVGQAADSLRWLELPAGLPSAAAAGQRLKLVPATGDEVVAVLARPAAAGARRLALRLVPGLTAGQPVFVFGFEHDDVRTVDYEALAMLNVSATQELARQLAALQARAETAETRAAQAAADHADLQTLKQQLARMLGEAAPATLQARH